MRRIDLPLSVYPLRDPADAAEALQHGFAGRRRGGQNVAVMQLRRLALGGEPLGLAAGLQRDLAGAGLAQRRQIDLAGPRRAVEAEAKVVAARSGRTLSQLIEDALRLMLASRPEVRRTRSALPTSPGRVRPGLDLDDTAGLLDAMDDAR